MKRRASQTTADEREKEEKRGEGEVWGKQGKNSKRSSRRRREGAVDDRRR
jgi:hypothetical protein